MSLETEPNKRETDQIGMDILYQEDIKDYIKRIIYPKKNIRNPCTVIWEFCNKHLQNLIDTNVEYEIKIQENPIEILKYIKTLIHKPE